MLNSAPVMFSTFEVDVEAGYVQYICMCMAVPACVDSCVGPRMTQEYVCACTTAHDHISGCGSRLCTVQAV